MVASRVGGCARWCHGQSSLNGIHFRVEKRTKPSHSVKPVEGEWQMVTKVTGKKAASSASKTLTTKSTGTKSKTSAGSALSQTKAPKKETSTTAAKAASKVLKDGRSSTAAKSAAGSALAQKPSSKKK